jgi:hypothetical protein
MPITREQIDEVISRFGLEKTAALADEFPEILSRLLRKQVRHDVTRALHEKITSPREKASEAHEGLRDVVLGDLSGPAYPLLEGWRHSGLTGAGKHLLGSSAGIAGGGALGYAAGKGLEHLGLNPHVWGIPLSTILSGLGATIGGVKGLQYARGR